MHLYKVGSVAPIFGSAHVGSVMPIQVVSVAPLWGSGAQENELLCTERTPGAPKSVLAITVTPPPGGTVWISWRSTTLTVGLDF